MFRSELCGKTSEWSRVSEPGAVATGQLHQTVGPNRSLPLPVLYPARRSRLFVQGRRSALAFPFILVCLSFNCANCLTLAQSRVPSNDALARIERDIEHGRLTEAETALLDYAIANPNNVRALELLAGLRLRQNRLSEAEALYRRVLILDPVRDKARISLAYVVFKSGKQQESRELLIEVAKKPPIDPVVRLSLAEGLLLAGEFEKSLAITNGLPPALKNTAALPLIAASELALGRQQKLLALIPGMLRAASNPVIAIRCAEVLQNARLTAEAIALVRKALAFSPNDPGVLLVVGRLEIASRNFAAARRHLNRAVTTEPRSSEILLALATLENAEGNSDAALSLLQKARTLTPDSPKILAQLALTAMRANSPELAVEAAKELLTGQPEDPEALYLFGAASLQKGNLISARDALERFVKQQPNDTRGCIALGITIAAQKDSLQTARSQFERCLQIDATNVEAKYQLGLLAKSEGETTSAIKLFEDVITRAPEHANALRDLGSVYFQANDPTKARTVLERAVALNPQDPETHFLLSRVYNRVGESALASRHLELFQKLKNKREKPSAP